jgi:hypothetical protein
MISNMSDISRKVSVPSRWRWLAPKIWGNSQHEDGLAKSDRDLINRRVRLGHIEADGRKIRLTVTGRKELRLPSD